MTKGAIAALPSVTALTICSLSRAALGQSQRLSAAWAAPLRARAWRGTAASTASKPARASPEAPDHGPEPWPGWQPYRTACAADRLDGGGMAGKALLDAPQRHQRGAAIVQGFRISGTKRNRLVETLHRFLEALLAGEHRAAIAPGFDMAGIEHNRLIEGMQCVLQAIHAGKRQPPVVGDLCRARRQACARVRSFIERGVSSFPAAAECCRARSARPPSRVAAPARHRSLPAPHQASPTRITQRQHAGPAPA